MICKKLPESLKHEGKFKSFLSSSRFLKSAVVSKLVTKSKTYLKSCFSGFSQKAISACELIGPRRY